MTLFHLFLVAVIQGVTEFLPVSSSGHLILLPHLTGYQDQGLAVDVAVHVGTLFAVILYFWSDVRLALSGLPRLATGRADTPGARLAMLLLIASVPVVAFGLILNLTGLHDALRSLKVIGWAMLVFGVLLYWSDQNGDTVKKAGDWSIADAMTMGVWQAIALIPGTSRSGITITGARFLGYNRHDAAKLAMLMSIPTIIASGVFLGSKVALDADMGLLRDCAIAAALAFIAALLALVLMMRLLHSVSYTPYVLYRIALGGILLLIAYS
ncbi:undecaprenyl-diphosphate phosphatase [Roseovarius sp. CAU 1744]|uniref:undecaprenyl-diphosphate phosphatase n=1 Tax=Roseovarius sp. CAU 1744 TaxID=3140368 RepID=UPI00325B0C46